MVLKAVKPNKFLKSHPKLHSKSLHCPAGRCGVNSDIAGKRFPATSPANNNPHQIDESYLSVTAGKQNWGTYVEKWLGHT